MAVVRMTLPDRGVITQMADALEFAGHPRGAREVRRADTRPGRGVELTAAEVYALYEAVRRGAYLPRRARALLEDAKLRADEAVEREARRARPGNIISMGGY